MIVRGYIIGATLWPIVAQLLGNSANLKMIVSNGKLLAEQHILIGITRVRNEALILGDTLDFVGRHVDAIIAYNDASTDRTVELLRNHPKVALVGD